MSNSGEVPQVKLDVMNPHYGAYYQDSENNTPPTDKLNPVPIPFLTIEKTKFNVIIGTRSSKNKSLQLYEKSKLLQIDGEWHNGLSLQSTCLNVGLFWLKKALKEHGIGAKTAVGYGFGAA